MFQDGTTASVLENVCLISVPGVSESVTSNGGLSHSGFIAHVGISVFMNT